MPLRVVAVGDSLLKGVDHRPLDVRPGCFVLPISGAGIREVIERARREVTERRPDVLYLHVGSNSLFPRQHPRPGDKVSKVRAGRHIAQDLTHHVERLLREFPSLHVIIGDVLPRMYVNGRSRRAHTQFNAEVKRWSRDAGGPRVWTTNIAATFDEHPELFSRDGTHLRSNGCTHLAHAISHAIQHVQRYMID